MEDRQLKHAFLKYSLAVRLGSKPFLASDSGPVGFGAPHISARECRYWFPLFAPLWLYMAVPSDASALSVYTPPAAPISSFLTVPASPSRCDAASGVPVTRRRLAAKYKRRRGVDLFGRRAVRRKYKCSQTIL